MEVNISELFLSLLAAGGGGAVIAFGIFRLFGENWMTSLFSRKLEAFRHENAKELQSLRAEIDGTLNLRIRVQEKEFEVLTESWDLMNVAFGAAHEYVHPVQSYQSISRLSESAQVEYLDTLDLLAFQKREILLDENPDDALFKTLMAKRRHRAWSAFFDFHNAVQRTKIFMTVETENAFRAIIEQVNKALSDKDIADQTGNLRLGHQAWERLEAESGALVDKISSELKAHLRSSISK